MDKAAQTLMEEYPDIVLAFGESDEFRCANYCPNVTLRLTLGGQLPVQEIMPTI